MSRVHSRPAYRSFALLTTVLCAAPLGCSGADDAGFGEGNDVENHGKSIFAMKPPAGAQAADPGGENVGSVSEAVNTGHGIAYYNGPVMWGKVKAYYIWYGDWAGNTATTILTDLINNVGGSPYYNINTLYDDANARRVINSITYGGAANDSYSLGTSLTDANVQTIVGTAIAAGLPLDQNGVYFVLTSPDVVETSGFCASYCGWHTNATLGGKDIKYVFAGNPSSQCPAGCEQQTATSPNGNPGADAMASMILHELEEATSDPDSNAWYNVVNGEHVENADKCAWSFGTTYAAAGGGLANMKLGNRDFLIQQNWLNTGVGACGLSYGGLASRGGNTGTAYALSCAAGSVAVGVFGRSSTTIHQLGLICAPLNADGTLGAATSSAATGGAGGTTFTSSCPAGQALTGLNGVSSGTALNKIGILCSAVPNWNSKGTVQYTGSGVGGTSGTKFTDKCVKGYVINRLQGLSAANVNSELATCAYLWPF